MIILLIAVIGASLFLLTWYFVPRFVKRVSPEEVAAELADLKKGQQLTNEQLSQLRETLIVKPSDARFSPEVVAQETTKFKSEVVKIREAVSGDAKKYLLEVTKQIDNSIRRLLALSGQAKFITDDPGKNALKLAEVGYISSDLGNASNDFFSMEADLVSRMGTGQAQFKDAGGAGSDLLKAFSLVPMSHYVIVDTDFPLFGDPQGKLKLISTGVMLDNVQPDGTPLRQVFSTTRSSYYRTGMKVSWEWNLTPTCGRAYYRDKSTNELVDAFLSSANFVGRDLDELLVK